MKTITYGITKTKNGYSLFCQGQFVAEYSTVKEAKLAEDDLHNYLNGKPSTGGMNWKCGLG